MLITECLYFTITILCIFSVILLAITLKNRDKNVCYWISVVGTILIIHMFLSLNLAGYLSLPVGFGFLFFVFIEAIATVLCIVSIIISCIKAKKLKTERKDGRIKYIVFACVMLPAIPVSLGILNNMHTINHSDIIVVYKSAGNGGLGDTQYFAYGINDNSCTEFDLGIDFNGYKLGGFLPSNARETVLEDIPKYKLELLEDRFVAYKDNQQICSIKFRSHYFNNNLEKVFYIK